MDEDNLKIELINKDKVINTLIPIMCKHSIESDIQDEIILCLLNIQADIEEARPYDHIWDMYYDEFEDYCQHGDVYAINDDGTVGEKIGTCSILKG